MNNPAEADIIIEKIMNTWNDKIAPKYARKLDKMNVNEKIRLLKETLFSNRLNLIPSLLKRKREFTNE